MYKFHNDFHFTYNEKPIDSNQAHQPHVLPIQAAFGDDEQKQSKHVNKRPKVVVPKKGPPKKKLDLGYSERQDETRLDRVNKAAKTVEIDNNNKIEIISPDKNRRQRKIEPSNEIRPIQSNEKQKEEDLKQQQQQQQQQIVKNEKLTVNKKAGSKYTSLNVPPSSEHNSRQKAVVDAFKHAWKGYKAHAWGKDELTPISQSYSTWFDIGLTMVDSLDTMWLMDLKDEFNEARDWVKESLRFDKHKYVNLFEVTIRVLGSLLSTYRLTDDNDFLSKAVSRPEI